MRIVAKVDELLDVCNRVNAAQSERERRRDRFVSGVLSRRSLVEQTVEHARLAVESLGQLAVSTGSVLPVRDAILEWATLGHLTHRLETDSPPRINENRRERARARAKADEHHDLPLPPIPEGWVWATMDDIASDDPNAITDGPFGAQLKTAHYVEASGYRVIRLQNIGRLKFRDEHRSDIAEGHFGRLAKHHVHPGDLVVAGLVDPTIRACQVPDHLGPTVVKADCYRFSVFPGLTPQVRALLSQLADLPTARGETQPWHDSRPDWARELPPTPDPCAAP